MLLPIKTHMHTTNTSTIKLLTYHENITLIKTMLWMLMQVSVVLHRPNSMGSVSHNTTFRLEFCSFLWDVNPNSFHVQYVTCSCLMLKTIYIFQFHDHAYSTCFQYKSMNSLRHQFINQYLRNLNPNRNKQSNT
jgi:hypothetical protein